MSPRTFYRAVAVTEAVTWTGLLGGMLLKYPLDASPAGVTIFGPLHGIAFIAFCLATLLLGIDQRWRADRVLLGFLSAIPPFATLLFELWARRAGGVADTWRLLDDAPRGRLEGVAAWLIRAPARGMVVGVVAVAALTVIALAVGV